MNKVLKTEMDYVDALAAIEKLMDINPEPGTPQADELQVLTVLVQDYEKRIFRESMPKPVEAIRFRMEQQNLTPRDLIPYMGSRSKVSEVLSKKRPLSLSMIRALHANLGIPARVLLQEIDSSGIDQQELNWSRFPVREMIRRRWVEATKDDAPERLEQALRRFFEPVTSIEGFFAFYRKTDHTRSTHSMDRYALAAWTARIIGRSQKHRPTVKYHVGSVRLEFMRELAKLSWSESGPRLAREFLWNSGIELIVEPHLPKTHLDGAAIMLLEENPVIGLTLRYDRIDNFWFSLMHELAHLALHMGGEATRFYDDLDSTSHEDDLEHEADQMAGEALIPSEEWEKSTARRLRSPEAAEHLAKKLRIHPAIVAGRMRHHFRAYRLLNQLVGHNQVRKHFTEVEWS